MVGSQEQQVESMDQLLSLMARDCVWANKMEVMKLAEAARRPVLVYKALPDRAQFRSTLHLLVSKLGIDHSPLNFYYLGTNHYKLNPPAWSAQVPPRLQEWTGQRAGVALAWTAGVAPNPAGQGGLSAGIEAVLLSWYGMVRGKVKPEEVIVKDKLDGSNKSGDKYEILSLCLQSVVLAPTLASQMFDRPPQIHLVGKLCHGQSDHPTAESDKVKMNGCRVQDPAGQTP